MQRAKGQKGFFLQDPVVCNGAREMCSHSAAAATAKYVSTRLLAIFTNLKVDVVNENGTTETINAGAYRLLSI